MKKIIFTFALLFFTIAGFCRDQKRQQETQVTADNVKMYRQPGTSTELLKSLLTTDKVVFVRKHNSNWTIVRVGDQYGYVLNSELKKPGNATMALNKSSR